MKLKQLSIFLENRPGALGAACRVVADAGINLITLSLADTEQFGILRVIVRERQKAEHLLAAQGYVVRETDVLAVEVPDQPGGLLGLLDVFERAGLNVEYMYAFPMKQQNKALLVFRFDNPDAAAEALRQAGVALVDEVELFRRSEP